MNSTFIRIAQDFETYFTPQKVLNYVKMETRIVTEAMKAQYEALQTSRNEAQKLMIAAKRKGNESLSVKYQEEVKLLNKKLRYLQKRLFYGR